MKKIIIPTPSEDTIDITKVAIDTTVFIKQNGKLVGMISNFGNEYFADGGEECLPEFERAFESKSQCMKACIEAGYELYIED